MPTQTNNSGRSFLSRDAMLARYNAVVVCPSVTCRYCVKTAKCRPMCFNVCVDLTCNDVCMWLVSGLISPLLLK